MHSKNLFWPILLTCLLMSILSGGLSKAGAEKKGPPYPVVEPARLEDGFDPILGDFRLDKEKPTVFVEYVGTGTATDILAHRILLESREFDQSRKPGNHIWLRIVNNTAWAISFKTASMSTGSPPEMVQTKPGTYSFAIADGSEIALVYSVEERSGKSREIGPHSRSQSWLPSGRSAIFSVAPSHLKRGRTVVLSFNYQWENRPTVREGGEWQIQPSPPSHRLEFHSRAVPD